MLKKIGAPAALLCASVIAGASFAQGARDGVVTVDPCIDLETREELLECYEDRVDELRRALDADGDGDGNGNGNGNEPETTTVDNAPANAESRAAGEIVAKIAAIREMEPDAYLITLDNGQTWRQSAPKRYLLRVGAEVHIQPSTWGSSYRLTDPDVGNFIQVTRVN